MLLKWTYVQGPKSIWFHATTQITKYLLIYEWIATTEMTYYNCPNSKECLVSKLCMAIKVSVCFLLTKKQHYDRQDHQRPPIKYATTFVKCIVSLRIMMFQYKWYFKITDFILFVLAFWMWLFQHFATCDFISDILLDVIYFLLDHHLDSPICNKFNGFFEKHITPFLFILDFVNDPIVECIMDIWHRMTNWGYIFIKSSLSYMLLKHD